MIKKVLIGIFFILTINLSGQINIGVGGGFTYSTSNFPNYELIESGSRNGFLLEINPSFSFNKKLKSDISFQLIQNIGRNALCLTT